MSPRIVVVGGGIVGLATAYQVQREIPGASVQVLEKENAVGLHQSSHNSGVLHCGLDYRPGSRRARFSVAGVRRMVEFCQTHGIAYELCGKLVVAVEQDQLTRLNELLDRGKQNGLRGLRLLDGAGLREFEPHAAGIAAIHVPEEGIADYPAVTRRLAELIQEQGATITLEAQVRELRREGSQWRVLHTQGEAIADFVVTCAGLHSDRVAALGDQVRQVRIVPFRGEYYFLRKERQHLVRNLIYPVPDPRFPFLGVHFTRRMGGDRDGRIEAGPNAVLALSREGYSKWDVSVPDVADSLTYPGLWRFLGRYSGPSWEETRRSFSRRLFCESLQKLVPEVREEDLEAGGSGVRAQAMSPDGTLVDDFHFVEGERELHVVNAPSPAATCSLVIGEEIARVAAARLGAVRTG